MIALVVVIGVFGVVAAFAGATVDILLFFLALMIVIPYSWLRHRLDRDLKENNRKKEPASTVDALAGAVDWYSKTGNGDS